MSTRTLKHLTDPLLRGKFDNQFTFDRHVWMAYNITLIEIEPTRYQHTIHEYMNTIVYEILYETKRIPKDLVRHIMKFLPVLCIPSCFDKISVYYYLPYPAWEWKKGNKRNRETLFCPFDLIEE